jgi:predicted enzyme related to lactoylglutathione lyase
MEKEEVMEQLPQRGFVWHELMTTDPEQAERFYAEVVGMSMTPMAEGPDAYRMATFGGAPVGGFVGPRPDGSSWPSGGPEPHWVASFGVEDADEAARKTRKLGGEVLLEPVDVPGMGRAAVLRDPQGAVFGVFASSTTEE